MKIDPSKLKVKVEEAIKNEPDLTMAKIAEAAGYRSEVRIYQLQKGKGSNVNPLIGHALSKILRCKVSEITA